MKYLLDMKLWLKPLNNDDIIPLGGVIMFDKRTDEYPSDILSTKKEIEGYYNKHRIRNIMLMPISIALAFIERVYRVFFPIEEYDDKL